MPRIRRGQSDTPTHTGKGESQTRKRDVQIECFNLSVDGHTVREIAEVLSISPTTVSKYVRAEEALRKEAIIAERGAEMARRLARLQRLSRLAEESRGIPGSGALSACGKFEEMINRIMGIEAPLKIDAGLGAFVDSLTQKSGDA